MDKENFIKVVNLLIDKKLKQILPKMVEKEVKKYMESGIEPTKKDFDADIKSLIPHISNKNPIIKDNKQKKLPQTEGKQWTKNPIINNILNETVQNFTGLPKDPTDGISYQQLMESEYKNIGDEFTFNTGNMMDAIAPKIPTTKSNEVILKQQVMMDGAPPEIANIMVKDYSKMLEKMDKAAQNVKNRGLK